MSDECFQIGAEGIDTTAVVAGIREEVDRKIREGVYADARIAVAERMNLSMLQQDDAFAGFYLRCLRDAVYVDISDFEIRERRAGLAPVLVKVKRAIWSALKFYTYRLWSQQNEVNGLLVTGIEGIDEKVSAQVRKLEARIAELEKRVGDRAGGAGA